jgi:peptide deformylase
MIKTKVNDALRITLETGTLNMRYYEEDPDPILSANCAPFEPGEFGTDLVRFSVLLIEKMLSTSTGIGLAAPQVGILKRAFAMKYPDIDKREAIVLYNPIVIPEGDDWLYNEGCLSVPGVHNQVKRPKNAIVRYQNEIGNEKRIELEMLPARIVQHENDHLNGIMFFDRLTKQMRKATLREWEKERTRRAKDLFGTGKQV